MDLDQCINYTSQFKSIDLVTNKPSFENLEQFGQTVLEFFKKAIDRQYPLQAEDPKDLIVVENKAQNAFMQSLSNTPLPDPSCLTNLVTFIKSEDSPCEMIEVKGSPGSGKRFLFLLIFINNVWFLKVL